MRTLHCFGLIDPRLNNDALVDEVDKGKLASHTIFFAPLGASVNQSVNALNKEVPVLP